MYVPHNTSQRFCIERRSVVCEHCYKYNNSIVYGVVYDIGEWAANRVRLRSIAELLSKEVQKRARYARALREIWRNPHSHSIDSRSVLCGKLLISKRLIVCVVFSKRIFCLLMKRFVSSNFLCSSTALLLCWGRCHNLFRIVWLLLPVSENQFFCCCYLGVFRHLCVYFAVW